MGHVRVDYGYLNSVHNSNGVNANLTIIEPIILVLQRGFFEDLDRVLERNAMTGNVPAIFLEIPNVFYAVIFTLCIYGSDRATAALNFPAIPAIAPD